MRIFPDARFLAAALATRGLATDLFEAILLGHDFVTGTHTLSETECRLQQILGTGSSVPAEAIELLCTHAEMVAVTQLPHTMPAKSARLTVLGEAAQTFSDFLVSADPVLRDQTVGPPVRVVSPRTLWSLMRDS